MTDKWYKQCLALKACDRPLAVNNSVVYILSAQPWCGRGREESSAEWHAQNKLSLTVFGASILAPSKDGGHVELYVLLASEVLDHDAQAANMLLNQVLRVIKCHASVDWTKVAKIWLVSDCGPHFRSYENVAHFCFTLVKGLNVAVNVMYLGEQHGKGACDRLFGWTNAWLQDSLQRRPLHGLDNLLHAYREGSQTMMSQDPAGAKFVVDKFEPGTERPNPRLYFQCSALKISRTYSLSSQPSVHAPSGVSIRNNVFSDLVAKEILSPWSIEKQRLEKPEQWRRGFYDKPRSWEQLGPQAGDVTDLTRKYTAQKPFKTTSMPTPKRSLEERLSAKARALSRQAAKRRRQMAAMKPTDSDSSTSSSSSSSASSSAASVAS